MPVGWRHSLDERIEYYNGFPNTVGYIDSDGNFDEFVFENSWTNRAVAKGQSERVLYRTVNQPSQGLVLREPNGDRKHFSSLGMLLSIKNSSQPSSDIEITYIQPNSTVIDFITDAQGRVMTFTHDGIDLTAIGLPDGNEIDLTRDGSNNLVSISHAGLSRTYSYDQGHALLTGVDGEDGIPYARFAYDTLGRVISSKLKNGILDVEKTTLTYTSNQQVEVISDGRGTRVFQFGNNFFRRLNSITDDRGTVTFAHPFGGLLTGSTDALGSQSEFEYSWGYPTWRARAVGTPQEQREAISYDYNTMLVTRRDVYKKAGSNFVVANIEQNAYDAQGGKIASCMKDGGNSTASNYDCESGSPAPAGVRKTSFVRCTSSDVTAGTCPLVGLLTSVNGPRTDVSDTVGYTYYPSDDTSCASAPTTCSHRKGDLWKVTNALGQVTETLAYDGAGRVLSVKDANGVVSDLEYHPRGWLTARKVRGANASVETDDAITRIEYWPTGLVKKVIQPDGAFTSYTYDAAHRLTDIADNAGNTIHYTLDNAGNRTQEDTKDPGNVLKRTLSRVYNQLGQLQTQADAQANPTDFTYDANGNTDTVTDALGRITDNNYDPLNRLSRTLQNVGGIAAQTQFAYDAQDNLTQVTDPKGLNTNYTYNGLGDLTQLVSPDTGTTGYTYDSAGNRATQTDARGQISTYSYDALNRLTGIAYSTSALNVAYVYDITQAACQSGETFAAGRLTQLTDASGSTQYCYDRFGHLVRKVQTTNGIVLTVRYAYTLAGQLSSVTYPDGAVVAYTRDGQGRATQVEVQRAGAASEVLLNQASYHPFGPVAGWTYGNGRQLLRPLNQNYQPTAIHDAGTGGLSVGFQYDPVGNLTQLTPAASTTPLVKFDYDALSRLTKFKDGPTDVAIESYAYDATGNRQSFTNASGTQAYTYPATSHRLTQVGATARTYDAAGNTTAIGGTAKEFVFDATGRMSQVKQNAIVQRSYAYNGKGEQVRKYAGTANTYTLYDEAGHWLGDYDNTGAALQQAIWLDDLPVGLIANGNQLHYIEPDHLGTPRVVIEVARNVPVWTWDLKSEAFGNSVPAQDPDGDSNPLVFDMRFPGQRYDAASELNQNGFRDYEPNGRYIQSDPIGLRGGISTYAYVASRPLTYSDPLGLDGIGGWMSAPNFSSPESRQAIPAAYQDYRGWRVWGHQQFPGEKNSFARHCTVSCILSKKYGTGITRLTGYINEYQGFYVHDLWDLPRRFRGERPWAFQTDDLAANEEGFKCANKQQCSPSGSDDAFIAAECEKCCTLGVMYGY